MIENVRLVVADIDGTLVTSDNELTAKTKEVIEKLHEKGIMFGIASGRAVPGQLEFKARDWGFDFDFEIVIGMNGSQLYDGVNKQQHDYHLLKKEYVKEILEMMKPFGVNPSIFDGGHTVVYSKDKDALRRRSLIVEKEEDLWSKDRGKVMYHADVETINAMADFVAKHPSPYYKGFRTRTEYYEFTDIRVSKAVALENFCKLNNIDMSEVMAFGDMTNDDEMLKVAGWGVCLANGFEATKAISNDVTEKTNDEDGFAHYIEKHVLSKFND